MSAKLQEAISATRNGDKVGAQKILADILKADTENTQAWYLLAMLVDSPEKKQAYLSRVLTLDPHHEKATEQLAAMQPSVAPPIINADPSESFAIEEVFEDDTSPQANFEDPSLFDSQVDDSIIPSWLEEDKTELPSDILVEEEPSEIFNADLPDWLDEASPVDLSDEPPTLVTERTPEELEQMLEAQSEESVQQESALIPQETQAIEQIPEEEPLPTAMTSSQPNDVSLRRLNLALFTLSILAILVFIALMVLLI